MPKLFVKNTFLFDNDIDKNFAFINPLDRHLFTANQVKIINRHGEHVFDKAFYSLVPSGYVALTRQQRKNYRLKKRHCYQVLSYTPNPSPVSIVSRFNCKFNYRERIGGADDVFETIFGHVLISRLYPRSFVAQIGLTPPRGFILYGPSGTGKTLIAKTLADILNVTPKIIDGLKLFYRPLSESLATVRGLFKAAHSDQKKYGAASPLHLIIFDEIDAICKRRSTENSSEYNFTHNMITRQISIEIDEGKCLNNIVLIGTTSVIELINPAVYRSGRLDTLIEVKIPNSKDRLDIFNIYTKTLLKNGLMSDDVDIEHLIRETDGMTGAHIESLVRRAIHSAMKRDVQSHGTLCISDEDGNKLRVKSIDFTVALAQLQTQIEKHTAF